MSLRQGAARPTVAAKLLAKFHRRSAGWRFFKSVQVFGVCFVLWRMPCVNAAPNMSRTDRRFLPIKTSLSQLRQESKNSGVNELELQARENSKILLISWPLRTAREGTKTISTTCVNALRGSTSSEWAERGFRERLTWLPHRWPINSESFSII